MLCWISRSSVSTSTNVSTSTFFLSFSNTRSSKRCPPRSVRKHSHVCVWSGVRPPVVTTPRRGWSLWPMTSDELLTTTRIPGITSSSSFCRTTTSPWRSCWCPEPRLVSTFPRGEPRVQVYRLNKSSYFYNVHNVY